MEHMTGSKVAEKFGFDDSNDRGLAISMFIDARENFKKIGIKISDESLAMVLLTGEIRMMAQWIAGIETTLEYIQEIIDRK